jgi:hypothetical protein
MGQKPCGVFCKSKAGTESNYGTKLSLISLERAQDQERYARRITGYRPLACMVLFATGAVGNKQFSAQFGVVRPSAFLWS